MSKAIKRLWTENAQKTARERSEGFGFMVDILCKLICLFSIIYRYHREFMLKV